MISGRLKSLPDRMPVESDKCKQKACSLGITEKTQNSLLEVGTHIDTARVRVASAPESGQWLHEISVPSLGTILEAEQLRICIFYVQALKSVVRTNEGVT